MANINDNQVFELVEGGEPLDLFRKSVQPKSSEEIWATGGMSGPGKDPDEDYHAMMDVAGIFNPAVDVKHAYDYAQEGDYWNAGINMLGIVPGVKEIIKGGGKVAKGVVDVVGQLTKQIKNTERLNDYTKLLRMERSPDLAPWIDKLNSGNFANWDEMSEVMNQIKKINPDYFPAVERIAKYGTEAVKELKDIGGHVSKLSPQAKKQFEDVLMKLEKNLPKRIKE